MSQKLAKVCIEPHKGHGGCPLLYDLNKADNLDNIMLDICKSVGLPANTKKGVFGLKLIERNKSRANIYIDEANYESIQDLDRLEVVFTIPHCLKRVFSLMQGDTKEESFKLLHEMSIEDAFINELAKNHQHITLMHVFIEDQTLSDYQLEACLLCFAHLFKNQLIEREEPDILDKVLMIACNEKKSLRASSNSLTNLFDAESEFSIDAIKYALMVLRNILVSRNDAFNNWKRQILNKLDFKSLLNNYIANPKYEKIKNNSLSLLISLIKAYKEDSRLLIIKYLNKLEEKEKVYRHIVGLKKDVENTSVAYDLYLYQTLLLSTYKQIMPVNYKIDKKIAQEFHVDKCEEFNRLSMFLDFDENYDHTESNGFDVNIDVVKEQKKQLRISLASILSDTSSRNSSYVNSVYRPDSLNFDDLDVSILTLDCLRYYKKTHPATYKQSKVEEQFYKPGIFATSQCVVNMLCKLLSIGSHPNRNYYIYQPLFFLTDDFFSELFSRTMWLLSKTRREMKATTISDFSMVMKVLHQQMLLILEKKHSNWTHFTEAITDCSFQNVLEYWKNKSEQQMNDLIKNHPCIYALQDKFRMANKAYVNEKRLRYMHQSLHMRKAITDKKPYKFVDVTIQLSTNNKTITIKETNKLNNSMTISLTNVEGIAHGRNCEHYIECHHDPLRALNIILENNTKIQLIAGKAMEASYWFEGLAILTNKEVQFTHFYDTELDELVEMDIRLRLIDLQDVSIPKRPPKVPPTPGKPLIPPKPKLTKNSQLN